MLDFVLNFQKITNVNINDKIEKDDFDDDDEIRMLYVIEKNR